VGPERRARDLPGMAPDPQLVQPDSALDTRRHDRSWSPRRGSSRRSVSCVTSATTRCTRRSTSSFLQTQWLGGDLRDIITTSLAAGDSVGAPTTWVLSNHDCRASCLPARSSGRDQAPQRDRIGDPQPDAVLGLRRARAATTLMLALPGSATSTRARSWDCRTPPTCPTTYARTRPGRAAVTSTAAGTAAACRCPGKATGRHTASAPLAGPGCRSRRPTRRWPSTGRWASRAQPSSCIARCWPLVASMVWAGARCVGLRATPRTSWPSSTCRPSEAVLVITNLGPEPVALPGGVKELLASGPLTPDGLVPTDTTAWLTT
jgi:alpha-glucosidase